MKPTEDMTTKYLTIYDDPEVKILRKSTRGRFKITKPIKHTLINKQEITVPIEFISNGASIPRLFRNIFSQYGVYVTAAIIHDYLYENTIENRKFADRQFLLDMSKVGTPKFTKWLFYYLIRIFGKFNWNKYEKLNKTRST